MVFNKDILLLIQKLQADKSKDVRAPVENLNLPLSEVLLLSNPLNEKINSKNNPVTESSKAQFPKYYSKEFTEILSFQENSELEHFKKIDENEKKHDQKEENNLKTAINIIKIEENKDNEVQLDGQVANQLGDEINPTAAGIIGINNFTVDDDKSLDSEKDEEETS